MARKTVISRVVLHDVKKLVPEGIAARVPYKGTLYEVIFQLVGGLRAGMGYCGAGSIEQLHDANITKIRLIKNQPNEEISQKEAKLRITGIKKWEKFYKKTGEKKKFFGYFF